MNRNETFPVDSVTTLAVRLAWAPLDVVVDDVEAIQLLLAGTEDEVADMKVTCAQGTLTVEQPAYGLSPKIHSVRWMQVILRIPRSWKGAVEASTIAGSLRARGLTGTDLSFETVTGELRVSSLNAISLGLRTVTGRVSGGTLSAERLELRSVGGDISIDSASLREVRFSIINGDLLLALDQPFDRVEGSTVSGDVHLHAPISEATVALRSVSGKLRTAGVSIRDEGARVTVTSVSGSLFVNTTLE